MSFRVVVRPAAMRDIEQALDWYLENAPEHAERFTLDLRGTMQQIRESPRLFRAVYGEVRRAALQRFPYLVWFVCFDEAALIQVLALSHQRQNPVSTRRGLN